MKQIMFDDQKSYDDFKLRLLSYKPDIPSVKEFIIDNPGADGIIDYTEWLGEPLFNNCHPEFTFDLQVDSMSDMERKLSVIADNLNGRIKKVYTGDGYYYYGRISMSAEPINNRFVMVVITVNADPHMYDSNGASNP